MEDLILYLGGATFTMKPESFTATQVLSDTKSMCYLMVVPENDASTTQARLGLPFMETYVISLDSSSNNMDFVVNVNAPEGTELNFPDAEDDGLGGWAIFGIIIGCLLALILIILLVCYLKGKGKKESTTGSFVKNDESAHLNDTSVNQGNDSSSDEETRDKSAF